VVAPPIGNTLTPPSQQPAFTNLFHFALNARRHRSLEKSCIGVPASATTHASFKVQTASIRRNHRNPHLATCDLHRLITRSDKQRLRSCNQQNRLIWSFQRISPGSQRRQPQINVTWRFPQNARKDKRPTFPSQPRMNCRGRKKSPGIFGIAGPSPDADLVNAPAPIALAFSSEVIRSQPLLRSPASNPAATFLDAGR
jgi:hypothetical protein